MKKNSYLEYQKDIGERIKQYRINMGLKQKDLENKSGVSLRSISRLEQGNPVQLESLIKVLIALNLDENIELLIPDQSKRPSFYLESIEIKRKRVHKTKEQTERFVWGDEKL